MLTYVLRSKKERRDESIYFLILTEDFVFVSYIPIVVYC